MMEGYFNSLHTSAHLTGIAVYIYIGISREFDNY